MSGSLTVTDGTNTVTGVGTITLNSAGTLSSAGSSNATITGSVQVYLPGGLGTDTGGASSTIPYYDTASQTGSTINLIWFENNEAVTTFGTFLTDARRMAVEGSVSGSGTVCVDAILDAAISYSSTNGVAIYVPAGTYELTATHTLTAGTTLIGAPGFQTIFAKAFGSRGNDALFRITGNDVVLQDLMVTGYNASYVNLWTNQFLPGPVIDLFDWQTVTVGNLEGQTPLVPGGWQLSQTSATNPALVPSSTGTVLYFDYLPFDTVLDANDALGGSTVIWNYCIYRGVTVTGVANAMIGSWSGYEVSLAGTSGIFSRDGFTPTALDVKLTDPISQTISNPDYIAQQAFPPAYIQFVASSPAYYQGDVFVITGDFPTFRNVASVGLVNGRAYSGSCRSPRFYNTHCLATFGSGGDAGFRFVGPEAIFDGCVSNSGDDGAQQSQQPSYDPYYLNSLNNPNYGFTSSTFAERWIGCDITTIGTGRACAIVVSAAPNGMALTWTANAVSSSSGSITFPASTIPAGLTLTTLSVSAPPWVPLFNYATPDPPFGVGYRVVNGLYLYELVVAGISGSTGGPSSTGTTLSTDGSCTWTWLSAGESVYIYDDTLSYTAPGAYVTGYASSGGTVTVTALAPDGYGGINDIPFSANPSPTEFIFLIANSNPASPPMVLNNSVDIQFERCVFRSVRPDVVIVQNSDSIATCRAAFHGCTFDGSWCVEVFSASNPMMHVVGNPIVGGGGCRVTVDECRFYAPAIACFDAIHLNSYINISRSELYPPHIGAGMMANVTFGGASQIDFVENTVWATQYLADPSYTAGVVTLGTHQTTYYGLVQPQNAGNARIIGNRFLGLYAGEAYATPGLNIDYASNVLVSNNIFAAAANADPYAAIGIAITSNAEYVISSGNIFATCAVAYSGTFTNLSINGNEVYGTGEAGYVFPPNPSYPGAGPQVVSWTPTLSCDSNPGSLTLTSVTQTGTILRTVLYNGEIKNDIQFTISGSLTVGGASGNLRISGLPYMNSSGNTQCLSVCPPISAFNWVDSTGVPVWSIPPGVSYMRLSYMKSGSGSSTEAIGSLTSVGATFSLSGFGYYISTS
jgi:hypothetical protein